MSILVIGGAGFIGQRVTRNLVARGESVVCLDPRPAEASFDDLGDRVQSFVGDVTRFDDLMAVIAEARPQAIINLAYLLGEGETKPHLATRVNVIGTDNTFEAARLSGINRVVYASSIAYHGATQAFYGDREVDEEERPVVGGVYTSCKQFNEHMAAVYNELYGLEAVAVRPCFVIGAGKPRGVQWHVEVMTKPALGERVDSPMRSSAEFLLGHVEDIAEIFVRAATRPKLAHRVYHTGGRLASLGGLAEIVRKLIPQAEIRFNDENGMTGFLVSRVDGSRVRDDFGFEHRSLEAIARDIIRETRILAGREPGL